MHIRKVSACFLLSFLLATLSVFARDVSSDYDHRVDFSKYRTYTWIHPPMIDDPLLRQRVEEAIDRELQKKGLRMASDPGKADLGVVVNGATKEKHTLHTFYDGFPGGWAWTGWGDAITTIETYEVGTIVVDLFDMDSRRVVWRGVATETISDKPEKNTKKINKAIEEMFEHFPPKETK
ncbi:MAG TPA: DUF4136 domain-containing protein [Terriglobia bacterium]|nr:DUF4136 domain-containing protein [Terriglobia bacterium]